MATGITGPLFKWFGSKWLSSRLLPEPTGYYLVEPFAGGAGYSLRHHKKYVVLAERDESIQYLWTWLIHTASSAAILEIPINLPEGTDIRSIGLSPGQALLLKNWQRTNNVGNCWTVSKWGHLPGQWTENTRSRVADQVGYVKHWRVARWEGFELLERHARISPGAYHPDTYSFFIDPPYQYNYQYRSKTPFDYVRLAGICQQLPGQVIVCEAACPKTGTVPDWLPFSEFGSRVTSRRKAGEHHHSRELIWCSGDEAQCK